jgi:hypothetical protein
MTYSLFSTDSGSILESYRTPERAYDAAARMLATEPDAIESVALVTFDDRGHAVESVEGPALVERLHAAHA